MKHILSTFMSCVFLLFGQYAIAQNDCPAYSPYSYFEESQFIQSNTAPMGQKMGGIWLPQASFDGKYNQNPNKAHIPDNRKTWAISIAHAWNYSRNILKQKDYPKMSYWMATVTQETQWACDPSAKWGNNVGWPFTGTAVPTGTDGCYQLEGANNSSAYGTLMSYYPMRFKKNEHPNLIGGDNFETSTLTKAFYDLATQRIAMYRWGWKWNEAVKNTCEPYAHEKLIASAYNAGIYAFAYNAQSFMTGQEKNCYWTGLPATRSGYATEIGDLMAVLENNLTYPITTFKGQTSTFDGYYTEQIAWSDLEEYFNQIDDLYYEINFQTQVIPRVQQAFIQVAGGIDKTVSFTALGPVIDAIILSLPKEDPMKIVTTSENVPQGPKQNACSGNVVPVSYIKVEGKTTFPEGMFTKLVANIQDQNYTVKWLLMDSQVAGANLRVASTVVGTQKELIVSGKAGKYTYQLEVCNGANCNLAEFEQVITIEPVKSTCGLVATTSSVKSTCQTSSDGKITVTVENGSGNYDVNYWWNGKQYQYKTTTNVFTLNNLPSGMYGIEIIDLGVENCKTYTNAKVDYTTASAEKLVIKASNQTTCGATLTGELVSIPSPKKWKIRFYTPIYFMWEKPVYLMIQSKNTVSYLQATEVGANPWEIVGNYSASFLTGDSVTISAMLINTPGAIQNYEIKVELYNEKNELKQTYTIPAKTLTDNTPNIYKAGTYKIENSVTLPTYQYQWTPTQGVTSPTASNTVVSAVNPLEGKYVLTATNTACVLTDSIKIAYKCTKLCQNFNVDKYGSMVEEKVCIGANFEETINATGLNLMYQWYKDEKMYNNNTATLSLSGATAKDAGIYYLKVKDACNQVDSTHNIKIVVDVCTNVHSENTIKQVVYPNPTNGKVIVDIEEAVQKLSVYSIDGKLLIEQENTKEINLINYFSGLYLLEIQTLTQKIVVKIYKN